MKKIKVETVPIRINLEDKKFLDKLLEEGKGKTIAECVSLMVHPHRVANRLMAMYCPVCDVEVPFTHSKNIHDTHCIECREQAFKEAVYREIAEERLLS